MEESDDYFYRLWYPEAGIKRVIKVQKSAIGDLKTKLHAALRLPADVSVSYTLFVSDDDEWYECDEHDLPPKGKLKIETSSACSLGTPKTEPCQCGKLEKNISPGPSNLPEDQSVSETLQRNDETTTDETISGRSGKGRQRKKKSKRKKTAPKSDRSLPATQNNAERDAAVEDDISTKVQAAPDLDCSVPIAEGTANRKTRSSSADQEPSQSEQSLFTHCSELSESRKANSIQETKENPEQTNLTSFKKQPAKFEIQKSSPPYQTLTKDCSRRINETVGAASETFVLPHVRHQYQHSSTDKYDDRTQIERREKGEKTTLTTKQSIHVNEDNYSHVNSIPALLDDSDGFDDDVDDTDIYNNDDTANLHSTESKYEDTQDNAQDAAIAKVPEIPKVKPCYIRLTALELTPTLQRQLDALGSKVDRSNSQVPSKSLDEGSQMHFVEKIPSVSSHSGRKSVMNIQTHHIENLLVTCKPNEATTVNNSAKDFQKKERPRVPMKVRMIRRRHLRGHLSKKNAIPSCNDVKLNDTTSTSKDNEHFQKIERPRVPLKVPMVRTKHYFGNFGLPENKNAALNWSDSKRRICYQVPANALRTKKNVPLSTSKKSSKTISSPVKKRLETPSRTCKNWSNASSNALKKWTKHLSILRQKDQRKTASASGSVIIKNVSEKVLKVCDSSDEIANHNITFNGIGQSSDTSRSVLKSSERSRKRKPERPIVKDEVYQYETRIKRRRKSEDLPKTELGDAREMDMMCLTKDSVGHEDPLDNDDGDDDFDDDNDDDDETYQPSEDELTSDGENEISDTMKEELSCKVEADNRVEGNARRVYDENQTQSKENVPWKSEKISQQLSIRNSRLTDTSGDHKMHSSRAFTENDADSYCNIITIKRPVLPQSNPNDTLVDVPSLGLNVPEVSSSEESEKTIHSPLMNSPMTDDKASSNAFQISKKPTESISCSLLEVDSEIVHLDRSANPTERILHKRKQETLKGSGIKSEKESLDMVCEEVISETILDKKLMEVESEESSNDGSSLSEQSMFTGSVDGSPSENETSGVLECLQVKHVNSAQSIGSVNKIEGEQKKCKREETQAQVELNSNHDQECSKETLRIGTNQDETGAYMYMSSLGQNRRKSERASDKRANKEMPENNSVSFEHTRENSVITTLTVRYDGDSFTGLENTDGILKQERRDLRTGAMSHPDRKDLFHCGKMENSFIDSSALIPVVVDDVMRKEDNEVVKNVNCGKSTFVNHKYKQYSLQQNSEKVNVLENVNTEDGPTKFIKEKLREKLSGRTSILTIDPVSPLSIDVDDSKTPDNFSQMEGKVHDMTVSEGPNQGKYHLRHRKEQIIFIESDDSEREDLFFSNRMKKEDADERFDPQSSGSDSSDDASSNTITPPPRCPNGRFMKMSSSWSKKKNVKPQKSKVPNQCDTASNNTTSSKATVSTKSTRQGSISRISEDITHFEENESNDGNSICADEEGHGRYSLRKRSKLINLVESDVSEDEDDKQNKFRINFLHEKDEDYEPVFYHHESENESTDEYENYDIENRSGVRYEFHRPELEDKWEYMFGEKGTFERLQSSLSKERHVGNELCLYDDSEAFRKCFEYMEWNCKMKCIFCDQVFELFSDFVQHFFEQNSCEKKVRQSNGYVCSLCGKRGMKKDKMLKHLLRMKSHGPKTAAFIPKSLNDDELEDHEQDWITSFTPGYRCKVCNNSRVWSSLCDSIIHIKLRHTNEDQGHFVYRKQLFEREKMTIGVQNIHVDMEQYKCIYCGEYCEDQDALLEHSEIHHKYESVFDRQHSSSHAVKSLKYFLRKKSESLNLMESDASDENDSTDQTSARKDNRYRKTTNRDKHDTCYEVQRPDLEGKWEFMYGEKGTFIRLEDNHVVKNLCVYENSEAFEKCFDYMEWNANMRCIICNREFELFSSFILHFLGKNSCGKSTKMKNKYGCPPCGKDRMTKDGLIRHMLKLESHGEKTAAFSPKVNNEDKVDREVYQDELKSFLPGYQCKVCKNSRIWQSLREAVVHIKECHTNEEQANFLYRKKIYEDGKFHIIVQETQKNIKLCLCSYCGQVCSSREYLLAHYASFHQDMASEELGKEQLLCPHCGKRYSKHHRDNFNRHLRYHTDPVICEVCGKILKNRNSYQRHKRTHKGKTYTCFCGKTCSNSNSFAQHVRRHRLEQNERQHKCEECDKSFIFKHHLHNHIASHHSTERKFKCSACGAGFKLKHHLKQHIESGSACSAMTDKT